MILLQSDVLKNANLVSSFLSSKSLASYFFQVKCRLLPMQAEGLGIGSLPTCLVLTSLTSPPFLCFSTELPSMLTSLRLLCLCMFSVFLKHFTTSLFGYLLLVLRDLAQVYLCLSPTFLTSLLFLGTRCYFSVQP